MGLLMLAEGASDWHKAVPQKPARSPLAPLPVDAAIVKH